MMPESRSPIHTATAGASAALFTWAVVLPLDVLRTRVQVVFFVGEGPESGGWTHWILRDRRLEGFANKSFKRIPGFLRVIV